MVHFVDVDEDTGEVLEPHPVPPVPFRVPRSMMLFVPLLAFAIPIVAETVSPLPVLAAILIGGMATSHVAAVTMTLLFGRQGDAIVMSLASLLAFGIGAAL